MKRILIVTACVLAVLVLAIVITAALVPDESRDVGAAAAARDPNGCALSGIVVLEAQAVPSATKVPCVLDELVGWTQGTQNVENGSSKLQYATSSSEGAQWTIELRPSCTPPTGATSEPPPSPDVRRHALDRNEDATAVHEEWFEFTGGCASYEVRIPDRYDEQRVFDELETAFHLVERSAIDASVRARSDGAFGLDPS